MDAKSKAKKSYEEFLTRMSKHNPSQSPSYCIAFVTTGDGKTHPDYYWSDNDITPTGVYKWILSYRRKVVKVELPQSLYEKLINMIHNPVEPLMMGDTEIVVCKRSMNPTGKK